MDAEISEAENQVFDKEILVKNLRPEKFVNCGDFMMCFRYEGNLVILVPYINALGRDVTKGIINDLIASDEVPQEQKDRLTLKKEEIFQMTDSEIIQKLKSIQANIESRIKKQNLLLRELKNLEEEGFVINDKGELFLLKTVPASSAYLENSNLLGIVMPFVDGKHPSPQNNPNLLSAVRKIAPDWHTENIIISNEKDQLGRVGVYILDL